MAVNPRSEIPDSNLKLIKDAMQQGEEAQVLLRTIQNGWLSNKHDLPDCVNHIIHYATRSVMRIFLIKGKRIFYLKDAAML